VIPNRARPYEIRDAGDGRDRERQHPQRANEPSGPLVQRLAALGAGDFDPVERPVHDRVRHGNRERGESEGRDDDENGRDVLGHQRVWILR
jgi:hypothetical protein